MKIVTEKSFDRDYARLPRNIQERVDKQLSLLFANPNHGSLQTQKMRGQADIWEARRSGPTGFSNKASETMFRVSA